MSSRSSESLPNPISIDISRAFASLADPLIATRDTRHGAYDPHDATASSPTSPVDDSPPRSSTAGVGLPRDRGEPGGVPLILRLRRAAWLAGAGERAVPTTSAGHVRGRASRGTSTDVTGAMPSRAARSPASLAARPRRRATRGFFFAAMRQGFSTADAPAVRLGARREPRAQPRRARRRRTCGRARAPPATATARWSGRRRTDARQTANPNARGREAHSVVDRDAFAFLRPPARTRR